MKKILSLILPLYLTTVGYAADDDSLDIGDVDTSITPPTAGGTTSPFPTEIGTGPRTGAGGIGITDAGLPFSPTIPSVPPIVSPPKPTGTSDQLEKERKAKFAANWTKRRNEASAQKAKAQRSATFNGLTQKLTTQIEDLLLTPHCGPITVQLDPRDLFNLLQALDQHFYCVSKPAVSPSPKTGAPSFGMAAGGDSDSLNGWDSELQVFGPSNYPRIAGWAPTVAKQIKAKNYPGQVTALTLGMGLYAGWAYLFDKWYDVTNPVVASKDPYRSFQSIINDTAVSLGSLIALRSMDEDNDDHQRLRYFLTLSKEQQESVLKITIETPDRTRFDDNGGGPAASLKSVTMNTDVLGLGDVDAIRNRLGYTLAPSDFIKIKFPMDDSSAAKHYESISDIVCDPAISLVTFNAFLYLDPNNKEKLRQTFFFTLNGSKQATVLLPPPIDIDELRQRIQGAGGPAAHSRFQNLQEIKDDPAITPETIAALEALDESHKNSFFSLLNVDQQALALKYNDVYEMQNAMDYDIFLATLEQVKAITSAEAFALFQHLDDDNLSSLRQKYFFTLNGSKQAQLQILRYPDLDSMREGIALLSSDRIPVKFPLKTLADVERVASSAVSLFKLLDDNRQGYFFRATNKIQMNILKATSPLDMYDQIYSYAKGPSANRESPMGNFRFEKLDSVRYSRGWSGADWSNKVPILEQLNQQEQDFFFNKLPFVLQTQVLALTDVPSMQQKIQGFGYIVPITPAITSQ